MQKFGYISPPLPRHYLHNQQLTLVDCTCTFPVLITFQEFDRDLRIDLAIYQILRSIPSTIVLRESVRSQPI
jgi:hypothetical protein